MAGVSPFVDVSVRLVAGMPFYPGDPEFERQPIRCLSRNVVLIEGFEPLQRRGRRVRGVLSPAADRRRQGPRVVLKP